MRETKYNDNLTTITTNKIGRYNTLLIITKSASVYRNGITQAQHPSASASTPAKSIKVRAHKEQSRQYRTAAGARLGPGMGNGNGMGMGLED